MGKSTENTVSWALYSGTHYSCGHLRMISQQDQTAIPAHSTKWTLWVTKNEKRKGVGGRKAIKGGGLGGGAWGKPDGYDHNMLFAVVKL